MNFWDDMIDGIIKNFSPIIAAFIAAVIAVVSVYITWKNYKNSHDATPPELLKYEKWLDIMKKRKEVLDNISLNSKEGRFPEDRETSFANTLELYERNAIWEGEVLSYIPEGAIRKKCLKINPQKLFYEDGVTPRPMSMSKISKTLISLYFFILILIIVIRITVMIILINKSDFVTTSLIPGAIATIFLIVLFEYPYSIVKIFPSVADVYIRDIKRRMDQTYIKRIMPRRTTIISRSIYILLFPGEIFPKSSVGNNKIKFLMMYILLYIALNSIFWESIFIVLDGASNLDFIIRHDLYKDFNIYVETYFSGISYWIILYFTICAFVPYIILWLYNLFLSNDVLDKYELRSTNSEWMSQNENIYISIKDGILIYKQENKKRGHDESSAPGKVLEFELSIRNVSKISERKSTFINPLRLKECRKIGRIIHLIGDSIKISFNKGKEEEYIMNVKINKNKPVALVEIK